MPVPLRCFKLRLTYSSPIEMTKLAVSIFVIFPLFLLSYARRLPLKEETVQQEALSAVGITVLPFHHKPPLWLRFPYPYRRHPRLRWPRVVSYKNDMLLLDRFEQARLIRSRVSEFHRLPLREVSERTKFGFPSDHHFLAALRSRDGGLIPERSRDFLASPILTIKEKPNMERGNGDGATVAGKKDLRKWFGDTLNVFWNRSKLF